MGPAAVTQGRWGVLRAHHAVRLAMARAAEAAGVAPMRVGLVGARCA